MKSYKKSKVAYLFFLILTLGIAIYDQLQPRPEQVQIVLENDPQIRFHSEMIATTN